LISRQRTGTAFGFLIADGPLLHAHLFMPDVWKALGIDHG
jgi:hypothetical protein